jgi:hypothetical protein
MLVVFRIFGIYRYRRLSFGVFAMSYRSIPFVFRQCPLTQFVAAMRDVILRGRPVLHYIIRLSGSDGSDADCDSRLVITVADYAGMD